MSLDERLSDQRGLFGLHFHELSAPLNLVYVQWGWLCQLLAPLRDCVRHVDSHRTQAEQHLTAWETLSHPDEEVFQWYFVGFFSTVILA